MTTTTTTYTNRFDYYELEAYLGEWTYQYDMDAIIDDATVVDYETGDRFWKDDIDLWEICEAHYKPDTRDWNPSDEALELAEKIVYCGDNEDIECAGFRSGTKIWFIQCSNDGCSDFWFGEIDSTCQDENNACHCEELADRYGFDDISEIACEFDTEITGF